MGLLGPSSTNGTGIMAKEKLVIDHMLGQYRFYIREPDKAYLGTLLWLPIRKVNTLAIKSALEFVVPGPDGQQTLKLWELSPHHIGVPREFIDINRLPFQTVNLIPDDRDFPKVKFESSLILDFLNQQKDDQRKAYEEFISHRNGILNISCGKGKSCITLHAIAKFGMNTLIVVNQKTILNQWNGFISEFLKFDGEIGIIQGNPSKWDWRHPITLATLQTLANNPDAVTPDMRRWFGVVVWDEIHHLSAPHFCITATMFLGRRYGLTATVNREDGTEVVYKNHIGPVFHKNLMQDVDTEIAFKKIHFPIPPEDFKENIIDKRGEVNIGKMRTYVGGMAGRNAYLLEELKKILSKGRKILALSHSKKQLNIMYEIALAENMDVGICTGDITDVEQRWAALRDKRLVFGTHQLVTEAIDEKSLDTLVWMTPFGSSHPDGGKNALQQGMGRIQGYRFEEGMKKPLVIIYDDVLIFQFHKMCNQLRRQLRKWPADEGGPYKFKDISGMR